MIANVIVAPVAMTTAATDLATIGSDLSAAHTAAAAPTVALIPAAADEVSAGIAHLFSQHGGGFQALAGQAAAFHEQFVQNLTASAFTITSVETDIATAIRNLLGDLSPFVKELEHLLGVVTGAVLSTPLGSLLAGLTIGIADQVFIAIIDLFLFLRYLMVALHLYLTTGQILSWSVFISNLFPPIL